MYNELPPEYATLRDDLWDMSLRNREYLTFYKRPRSSTGHVYTGYWAYRDWTTRYVTPFTHGLFRQGLEPPGWAEIREEWARAAYYDTPGYFSQTNTQGSQRAHHFPALHMIPSTLEDSEVIYVPPTPDPPYDATGRALAPPPLQDPAPPPDPRTNPTAALAAARVARAEVMAELGECASIAHQWLHYEVIENWVYCMSTPAIFLPFAAHCIIREYVLFKAQRRWRSLVGAALEDIETPNTEFYKEQRAAWRYRLRRYVFGWLAAEEGLVADAARPPLGWRLLRVCVGPTRADTYYRRLVVRYPFWYDAYCAFYEYMWHEPHVTYEIHDDAGPTPGRSKYRQSYHRLYHNPDKPLPPKMHPDDRW